jgi:hypothetical protein
VGDGITFMLDVLDPALTFKRVFKIIQHFFEQLGPDNYIFRHSLKKFEEFLFFGYESEHGYASVNFRADYF